MCSILAWKRVRQRWKWANNAPFSWSLNILFLIEIICVWLHTVANVAIAMCNCYNFQFHFYCCRQLFFFFFARINEIFKFMLTSKCISLSLTVANSPYGVGLFSMWSENFHIPFLLFSLFLAFFWAHIWWWSHIF